MSELTEEIERGGESYRRNRPASDHPGQDPEQKLVYKLDAKDSPVKSQNRKLDKHEAESVGELRRE